MTGSISQEMIVTPEMLDAGIQELRDHSYGEDVRYLLACVFRAMAYEEPPPRRPIVMAQLGARLIAAAPDLAASILNSDSAHWTPAMRAALTKAGFTP